jgi:uncharacterized alpha/beta hydrolase family protein
MQTMQKKKKKEKTDPKEIKNLICFINSQDLKATTLFQKIQPFERKRERGKDAFGMERIEEKEETLIIKLDKKMKKRIIFFFLEKKTEIQKYLLMGALCTS